MKLLSRGVRIRLASGARRLHAKTMLADDTLAGQIDNTLRLDQVDQSCYDGVFFPAKLFPAPASGPRGRPNIVDFREHFLLVFYDFQDLQRFIMIYNDFFSDFT